MFILFCILVCAIPVKAIVCISQIIKTKRNSKCTTLVQELTELEEYDDSNINENDDVSEDLEEDIYDENREYRSRIKYIGFLIKLLLIGCVITFALFNYRRLNFTNGWSKSEINSNMSMSEAVLTLTSISKIEYYDTAPFPITSNKYKLYVETSQKNYLLSASQKEINALTVAGVLADNIKPKKITPIPYYVEIIACLIVLAIPFGIRKPRTK